MVSELEIEAAVCGYNDKLKDIFPNGEVKYCHAPLIKAALEAAEKIREEWQPINTTPKKGPFLAWCKWHMSPIGKNKESGATLYTTDWQVRRCWSCVGGRLAGGGNDRYIVDSVEATHWMPIPTPPKKEDKI